MKNKQIQQLGEDLQSQFTKIGEDLKNQLLKDYNDVLQSDLGDIKSLFENYLKQQNQKILNQSQADLQNAISKQIGVGLGNVFAGNIFPSTQNISSDNFVSSNSKNMMDLGATISRITSRNG